MLVASRSTVVINSRGDHLSRAALLALHAQVFAQPIFETAEKWIGEAKLGIAQRPALMRALVRCTYVAATCVVAILVPFMGDLMG